MEYLSIYLDAANTANLPEGWSRDASFRLTLFDQVNEDKSITKGIYMGIIFTFSFPFKVA